MLASPRLSAATRRLALAGLLVLSASSARADTIIKLGLGGDSTADIQLSGGVLSTVDDGNAATSGDQDTNVELLGFLDFLPDIAAGASFTLDSATADGNVFDLGIMLIQNFLGGTFSLYDASNNLLLSASLDSSVVTGVEGAPGTGAFFSTTLASLIPGGALDAYVSPGSISISISLTDVNGGAGLSVSGGTTLNPFTSDATLNIAADEALVPEPHAAALLALAGALLAFVATRAPRRSARCTVRGSSAARRR